jgi:hypothetical protein
MESSYARRVDALVAALGSRVGGVREASVPNELVVVIKLGPAIGGIGA